MTTAATIDERAKPTLSDEELVALHRALWRSRQVDERARQLVEAGEIGFHVSSRGEEAAIIGAAYALGDDDWLFPSFRDAGAALLRGMPLRRYLDNLFGNAEDVAKGRQQASYFSYRDARVANPSAPNGANIGVAVGFAWAAKLRGESLAVLACFGDEATSSNDFHNGMNFAGVFAPPAILFCRNDSSRGLGAAGDRVPETAVESLAEKGEAYGVHAVSCDGGDVLAVIATVRDALERARRGDGTTFIEAVTQRGAELGSDADPVERFRRHLAETIGWDDTREAALVGAIDAEIDEAIAQAKRTGPPPVSSMFDDVFEQLPWHLREQRDELLRGT